MITKPVIPSPIPETNGETESKRVEPHRRTPGAIPEPAPTSRGRILLKWIVTIALIAAAWHFRAHWLPWLTPFLPNSAPPAAKSAARVIPVRTAEVQKKDLELWLNGLGTVTAFKTVTLKSRVDGELVKVTFTEGQMVNEGDLLAEIDPRPFEAQLKQAEGQLTKDEASLKLAKLTLARVEDLARSKSIALQQVDEQVAQVQQMEGTIETDRAMVATARLQLTYCRVIAPISGRIGLRMVDQGNIVHANDPTGLAVITQLHPISLVFTIPQDDLPQVQKRMREDQNLRIEAYDRDFKTKLAVGALSAIDNQVDSTTGTVRLKGTFENEDATLFPNQFVNARLLVDTRRNAIVVPAAAVQRGPNGTFAYVVKSDETAELRMVAIGPSEAAETVIETGLEPGELVVTDGVDKLQNGSKISTNQGRNDSGSGQFEGQRKSRADAKGSQ